MKNNKKRNTKGGKLTSLWLVIVLALVIYIAQSMTQVSETPAGNAKVEGLEMVIIPEGMTNETYSYTGFTTYFNRDTHIPNCTSYELTRQETNGDVPRASNFAQDPNLEGSATSQDYSYSGYDRGHMVPAGDMKWDATAMEECFYMTNIVPQKKALNSGAWNKLESKIRNWAERDSALIVITGPIVTAKDLNVTIGDNNVVVPGSLFKIVLAPYATPMRAIAFIYPNEKANGGLEKYAVSVDAVEEATGMDFFSTLPDDIEATVEATYDLNIWNKR